MENNIKSLKELKKRKMLLVLPFLVLPFLTMLFWSLKGEKDQQAGEKMQHKKGFNLELPSPSFTEDSALSKMSYYDRAALDSVKLAEQIKKDPNYAQPGSAEDAVFWQGTNQAFEQPYGKTALEGINARSNEEKVYQKLRLLEKTISTPSFKMDPEQDMREFSNYGSSVQQASEMQNLEQLMSRMSAPAAPDPELKELGGMLENILDIQHPGRVEQRLKQASEQQRGKVFPLEKRKSPENISSLQKAGQNQIANLKEAVQRNAFFSTEQDSLPEKAQNALQAVVHQTQTLVNGSTVKLRLSSDVMINGVVIPKNTFLFGIAALKAERLEVKIEHIQYQNSIFPVDLLVYDTDGISGIYIPGTISRDVAKASAERSIQTVGVAGLDDSWGAQAAGMGIEAAKSLMSKKVKLVKVVVKAGYRLLLYDAKENSLK